MFFCGGQWNGGNLKASPLSFCAFVKTRDLGRDRVPIWRVRLLVGKFFGAGSTMVDLECKRRERTEEEVKGESSYLLFLLKAISVSTDAIPTAS